MMDIPGLVVQERRHSRVLQQPLAASRGGIMLHYDDSSRDDWAVAWFNDARCTNGYTWLVLDDGRVVELADPGKRTPHAGACSTPLANSVFYGVAAATNGLVPATEPQLASIADICSAVIRHHGWSATQLDRLIVGHDQQAVWTAANTRRRELWGHTGRKVDPTGQRHDGRPIIHLAQMRARIHERLKPDNKGDTI
ncbi:MAG: peptidoglycan recognition protein family protein [Gemmatimonadaceae bacterium]